MKVLNKAMTKAVDRPVKVLQFGEGNFLRGFVDYMIDVANEKGYFNGNIAIIKPIAYGNLDAFHEQECQYTLALRGKEDGETKEEIRVITSVSDAVECDSQYVDYMAYSKLDSLRFVVSNTTEAGIVFDETDLFEAEPPKTYPGKLTKFLYERFKHFNGDVNKGLVLIPCELIEDNGKNLQRCVLQFATLWNLGSEFVEWLGEACIFCSTLVDRIVTGYPRDEAEQICEKLGYTDKLLDTGELFALWVIESDRDFSSELPLDKAGLPVLFVRNQKPYRERKVRILNGAHTSFDAMAYLYGYDYVGDAMNDATVRRFVTDTIWNEIIPTLSLSQEECDQFAKAVVERFENPFIKHSLLSISLNTISKWKSRCLPSFRQYATQSGKLPEHLTFSLAAILAFYTGSKIKDGALIAERDKETYKVLDDAEILKFFADASAKSTKEYVQAYLSNEAFFGEDMTKYEGLSDKVTEYLEFIRNNGMKEAVKKLMNCEEEVA